MALSCEIKEQIFTFQGKDYNYTEFRRMMIAGLMDAVEGGKSFLVAGEGDAKNVVDVLDSDALDAFLQDASGNNALGISKGRIINQAIRAMNSLVASGKGYNEQTGKGVRIFISKTHADHQAAQQGAEGKRSNNRGFIVPRVDEAGNEQGYDIYINLEAASAATVGHEVMHFYLTELFGEGSPLLSKFVDSMNNLLKGSDIQYLTAFASRYKEGMRPEEYLVEMGGMLANRMASADPTAKEQTLFEKIADLFNEFLYKVTKGRVGYTIDVSSKTAVQEFFESLAGAVADGKAFSQQLAEAAKKEVEQPAADSSQEGVSQEEAPSSKESKIPEVLTTFAADEKARSVQEAKEDTSRGVPSRSLSVDPATRGEDFYKAIREASRRHKLGRAVDVKDKEFYTSPGTKLFLAEDETAGVAVTDYGDLVSVFKAPGSSANINELLAEAAEESMTLDAFDINGFLPDLYAKHGFVPVARVPFNEQYAPEGWPYELAGKPDVVLMVRDTEGVLGVSKDPYSSIRDSVPSFENYDDAVAEQKKAIEQVYQQPLTAEGPVRPEAMESKISESVSAPALATKAAPAPAPTTEAIPAPTDITAKEQNILAVYDETGFITSDSWAAALANNRQYLDKVIESILKARGVLKKGKVTTRGTASAYLITVASMGSSGTKYEVWSSKHGKKLSSAFIENNDGVEWLRPEGIAAAYLSTDKGKKLLDAIDSNTATEKQVRDFVNFIGLGYQNSKTENIMKTLKSGGIKKMTDLFNTNKGSDFDQLYKGAIDNLYGIKTGKTGFFNQFLGVASRGVVDAREYNAWIAGIMKLSKSQQEFREKAQNSPALQAILLERIKEVGLKLGYSEDIAAYIAHHAIWDSVANEVNTHTAEYEVVLRNLGVTDESIDLSVNDLGLSGVVDSRNAVKSKAQEISSELKQFNQNKNVKSKLDVPISQFDGKRFNVMESDRLVGAYIEDDQKNVVYRFYGGVAYPYITGKWWASRKISTARSIAKNANNNRDKDGYIYSAPMVGLPTQHMSNEDMLVTTIRLMRQDALAKGKGVTKEELINYINKAFERKSIKKKKKILESILSKNKTINTLFDELEYYLLQDGKFFVDKQGNLILDENGEKIKNFSFENRIQVVQGILGDPKVKSPKFPSVGSMSQMAKRFEEPITSKATDVGDLVAVYRTKGTLVAKQTSTSDPFYHRSYPAEIYAVDENGNPAKIEVFYLDAAYRLRSVLPVLRKSDGNLFDYEEYSRGTFKGKPATLKQSVSNYARTAKLSRASGIVKSVLSKAQEIPAVLSSQDPLTHPLDGIIDKEGVGLEVLSTPEQKEKYSERVWNLYEESYREIGLPITKDQWHKELADHVANIVIEGGELVAFSMTKPSKFGNKMTAFGSLQNEKDRGYAKMMLVSMMNRPGFYAELSKAARAIALKNDVPIVETRFVQDILAGKNPRLVNNIDYVREIGSVGEQNKTIFGRPWKTQEKKESYPSVILTEGSKTKYLTEHKAGKSIPTLWPKQRVSGLTDTSLMTLMSGRTKSEKKAKFSVIPSASANEESREFITVAQRRIDKLGFDGRDADAQVLRDRGLFKDPEEFEMSRKAAGDLFAQTLYDPAIASLPPLEIAKAMVDKIDTIENLPSKIYFSGNVHAFIDDMVMSKKIGKKLRGNLKALSDGVVAEMALKGREYGQASAMFARVYSDFKKFDFLVQKKKMEQEMEAKFNSTQLGDGKNLKDAVEEVRSDVEELLSQSSELSELVELAGEVNDTYMSDHADAVAQGDISGLKDPKTVTAEEFIDQKNKFEEVIKDLENKIKGLQDRLADVTKLYTNEQTKNASQAKTISDLRGQISKLNALIDKLRESNKKISAKASYYKQELQKLRDKFANLKSLLAILKANKYISKQRQDKMMQALIDMITGGKLDDPDFDSVFGEVFQISVVRSKDKAALESLANGLKYLAENPNSEISQAYIKRFNDYLESVSTEAWDSYRVASLLHSMFYTSVLSGWGTVFNATFGSIFTAVPNASLYSFVNIILNPKTAIGSIFYGMRRMAMETPAAASKGVFAQGAYDNLGTSWRGENLTDNADLAEVHLVKGFARNLDRLKKGDIKSMPKNLVAVLGSIVYPLTVIKRLMMFIDPTVTHMLSSYVQGSMEYKMAVDELKTIKSSAPKDMLDVLTSWSPFLNLRHLRKIDEHVNYAKKDRKAAADQALEEIDKLKDKGIKIERDYARRRTSQILREKIGKERALMFDKIARDWLMMWRPDGIIGAAWESSTKGLALKRDNEKNGGAFMNYSKTAISILFFTFLRITGAGINIAQAATPIFGLPLAIFGVRKNHQEGRGVMGQWGWGYKYKTSKEGVLAPLNPINIYKDLRAAEDFESKRAVSRIGISLFSHMVMFAVLSNMFDMADDEEEDETGYVDIPLLGKFKLSEDRAIDITSSGTGGSPKSQEAQEGRVSFAVRFKDGDKWGRWMSYKLAPHVLAPLALIGRAADDAKGIYYNPKGMADTARPAEGIMEYGAEIPLAIGEWSFNSLGRLWSSSRYDASGAFTKFMLNPFYAIAQPRAASDIITMSEDMLDLPKKNLYEGEGASDALTNLNYSIYGVGRLFAPDATDQFGLPVKTINPITNWWAYASDESLRSKEIPEWNLAYRYQNTNIPSNMSFRIERVDATTGSGHLLDSDQKKYLSDYEKYVSLSSDEQTLVTNLVKAEFRKRMLDVYETLPKEADEYSSSDYIDPGEYVSEEINKILKEAKEYVKDDVILMVNASDRKEKQKYMDGIFKYTDKVNRESNEISKKILSSGPLPMTGLGRDVKRRVRVKKITL
jgi:hypothetical protein